MVKAASAADLAAADVGQGDGSRFWKGESKHVQESGVVVVDRWRHL
jgi:hypothetical protein